MAENKTNTHTHKTNTHIHTTHKAHTIQPCYFLFTKSVQLATLGKSLPSGLANHHVQVSQHLLGHPRYSKEKGQMIGTQVPFPTLKYKKAFKQNS